MKSEYEVKILNIDVEKVKEKLKSLEANLEWSLLQRRYIYDFSPKRKHEWIRLRTNGLKTTLTIKNIESQKLGGTKELEIKVDDFDKTNELLETLGYKARLYQENKRMQYKLNGVEIDIDSWPFIPDYLEIEGENEKQIDSTLKLLGFAKKDCVTIDVEMIYDHYGYNLNEFIDLKLEEERK